MDKTAKKLSNKPLRGILRGALDCSKSLQAHTVNQYNTAAPNGHSKKLMNSAPSVKSFPRRGWNLIKQRMEFNQTSGILPVAVGGLQEKVSFSYTLEQGLWLSIMAPKDGDRSLLQL